MLEEGELDPNGELFKSKPEERNWGLGCIKSAIAESYGRSPIYDNVWIGNILRRKRETRKDR